MTVRMGGVINYQGSRPKLGAREWNKIKRTAGQEMAQHFFDHMLAIRFTVEGGRKLNYGKRSPATQRAKSRKKGHQNPLVWSGVSRKRAMARLNSKTVSTSTTFRTDITLNTPALNLRNPKSNFTPSEEIRRVTAEEETELQAVLQASIERQLNNLQTKESRKI